ncbi:MAG: hypothetical protein ACOC3X_03710 [Nanoarchaeota archaeon]
MNLNLELKLNIADEKIQDLLNIILADIDLKYKRSSIDLIKNKNDLLIKITSMDVIALKTSFNSIIKILEIYNKTKKICNQDAI